MQSATRSPLLLTNAADPAQGTPWTWTDESALATSNDDYAECAGLANFESSRMLYITGYGSFGIPAGSTILGVKAEIESRASVAGPKAIVAQLVVGDALVGNDQTVDPEPVLDTADTTITIGDEGELWDYALTQAEVEEGSGFGIAFQVQNLGANLSDVLIDSAPLTVYWEPPEEAEVTATFDPALSELRDHIRLALGDTDTAAPLLVDETIDAKLAAFPYAEALAQCAEALITLFGQRPSEFGESGGVKIAWADRKAAWQDILKAARTGKIPAPGTIRTARSGIAVQQTALQAQTPMTARTDSTVPTAMEGFRAD